jgi:hypothetical protein
MRILTLDRDCLNDGLKVGMPLKHPCALFCLAKHTHMKHKVS